jgi:hypothetical protein
MTKFKLGDRFIKTNAPSFVWEIVKMVHVSPNLPHHYQLVDEVSRRRNITMSESALLDLRLYQRVTNDDAL